MIATIKRFGEGTCIWCTAQAEGVEAELSRSLSGFLCRRCFWQSLKIRGSKAATKGDTRQQSTQSTTSLQGNESRP